MITHVRSLANTLALIVACSACAGAPRSADTIVIASGTDLEGMQPLTTVHPLSRQVQRFLVFTPMVRLNAALDPEPWAAQSWRWNTPHTQLAFVIDTSLRWHDGSAVTAADAAFTISLAMNPEVGYARRSDLLFIAHVSAPTPDTLVLDLRDAQPAVPLVFAELPLLPAHVLGGVAPSALRRAAFTTQPVGSGPYRVVSHETGRRWIFERVANFPARMGGVAATKTLVVAVVDEATTKVAALVSGAVDMAGVNPATATLVRRDSTLRVLDYPTYFTNWIIFNRACESLRDVRVRRAIAVAIDRSRIVSAGVGGFGVPSAAPSGDQAHDTTLAEPALADSLLDAAGWLRTAAGVRMRNGAPLAITMLTVGTGDNPVEQLMQADLRARGITLTIATRDMGALLSSARSGSAAHCATYTGVAGDPSRSQLAALFDPASANGALEFGESRPENLATLFASARSATDSRARAQVWPQIRAILNDSVPATPIFHSRGVQGLTRRLQHIAIDLRGELYSAPRWILADAPRQ
jgi:peptide/nickel transport system substrate-binding protein